MSLYKQMKNQNTTKGNRLLISITVIGSADPIRFVVNELELVAAVIDTALKSYAREGRFGKQSGQVTWIKETTILLSKNRV